MSKLEWDEKGVGRAVVDGFDIKVRVEDEDDGDPSYLGEFHADRRKGAIDWQELMGAPASGGSRNLFWYSSCNYDAAKALEEDNAEELRYIKEDIKRLLAYGESWGFLWVHATASRDGNELGSSSVGGIESSSYSSGLSNQAMIENECWDEVLQAVAEAKEKTVERYTIFAYTEEWDIDNMRAYVNHLNASQLLAGSPVKLRLTAQHTYVKPGEDDEP